MTNAMAFWMQYHVINMGQYLDILPSLKTVNFLLEYKFLQKL